MKIILFFLLEFITIGALFHFNLQAGERISLVWVAEDSDVFFQKEWIKTLCSDFDYLEEDRKDLSCLDDKVVLIISESLNNEQLLALSNFKKNGGHFGAFHIGDEAYQQDVSWYPLADFIFREYYFKDYKNLNSRLDFIPLGSKQKFRINLNFEVLNSYKARMFDWSFLGQVDKSNRPSMIKNFQTLHLSHFINFNKNFGLDAGLKTEDYQSILLNTKLAPCPLGWVNPDTFRLYESLECGCIPIVEDPEGDYFSSLYLDPPFLIVKNWSELHTILQPLLTQPETLEQKRQQCFYWWVNEKARVKNKIAEQFFLLLKKR